MTPSFTRFRFASFAVVAALVVAGATALGDLHGAASLHRVEDPAIADSIARARQDSINRAQPGYVVDSILPLDEEIRRFRVVAGPEVSELTGGESSRDALVRAFARAVELSDTAALSRMTLSIGEFASLIYPTSPFAREPYRQPPGLLWRTIVLPSEAGRARLLARMGGKPLPLVGLQCAGLEREGPNRLHTGCRVDVRQANGAIVHRRLFGTIIEHNGQYKFVSLQNDM